MALSRKQQLLLDQYKNLLVFGYSKMQTINLDFFNTRLKKKILYLMMAAVQSYSEGILKLVTPFSDHSSIFDKASEVLIRSLSETLINVSYIYSVRGEERARRFVAYSTSDKLDFASKYRGFMEKYPSWNFKFGDKEIASDWGDFILEKESELKAIRKKYKHTTNMPGVRGRAEAADNYLRRRGKLNEKTSLEGFYVRYYKFFSQMAHLTLPGLERFFDQGGMKVDVDGKPVDMERIVLIAYQLYFVMLVFFLKKFDAYDASEIEEYKKISKSLIDYRST